MNEKTEDPRSKTSPKRGLKKGAVVIIEKKVQIVKLTRYPYFHLYQRVSENSRSIFILKYKINTCERV